MKRYLFGKNKALFVVTLIVQLLATILTTGAALILSVLVDTINKKNLDALYPTMMLVAGYAIMIGVSTCVSQKIKETFRKRALFQLRQDVMSGILNQDIVEFQKGNSASYISLCNNNIQMVEDNYFKNIIAIYTSACTIVIAAGLMFYFNWIVAVVAIALSIIPTTVPSLFGKQLGNAQQEMASSAGAYNMNIKDIFNGFDVIKSYTMANRVKKEHTNYAFEIENKKAKQAFLMADVTGVSYFLGILIQFMIILFAGFLAIKGYLTLGNIIAITQLTGMALNPATALSSKFGLLKSVKPIIAELLVHIDRLSKEQGKVQIPPLSKGITFENVHFGYDDTEILKGVDVNFEKNKKYAIVGKSGSGKSTLLKLLLHYYDTYKGVISMDTYDYQNICAEEVNKHCAFLQQSVFLFDDTIKNNITLFEDVEDAKVDKVIGQAGLSEMVQRLPRGIYSKVGESGSMLSGGEAQRIAIARSLLKGADVLLLDEATSALDNETASYIEHTILDIKDMTSVVVTHRLKEKALALYDEIIIMDQGKIVDKGNFQELLSSSEKFKQLLYASM